jgi:hypothetical protein
MVILFLVDKESFFLTFVGSDFLRALQNVGQCHLAGRIVWPMAVERDDAPPQLATIMRYPRQSNNL